MQELNNHIGGEWYANARFVAPSPFDPDFQPDLPQASMMDAKIAASLAATEGVKDLARLGTLQRLGILESVERRLHISDEAVEYAVRMMGMPITSMRTFADQAPKLVGGMARRVKQIYPLSNEKYFVRYSVEEEQIELREPLEGFAYAIVPGNDPRATAHVISALASVGMPAVLKASKNELPVSLEIVQALVDAGYPATALQVLCWDTGQDDAKTLNSYLCQQARAILPFGDDLTVNRTLRYDADGKDNFAPVQSNGTVHDKVVLKHPSGRCTAIVDTTHPENTVDQLIHGAFTYPITCRTTKSVFVVGNTDKFAATLAERAAQLTMGDPLAYKTEVGLIANSALTDVVSRFDASVRHGTAVQLSGQQYSDVQHTPIIALTKDPLHIGLTEEFPAYVLTVKGARSLQEAIWLANVSAARGNQALTPENKRLVVSLFSNAYKEALLSELVGAHAYHRKVNGSTLDLVGVSAHHGNDYLRQLTVLSTIN